MNLQFTCALTLAASLALGTTAATAEVIDWKTIGGWDISFYPDSEGCQAFAVFERNTAFFIGFDGTDNQLTLDITLLDQRWSSIEEGRQYDVSVKFGNESPWNLSMDGLNTDGYPGLNIMIDAGNDQASLFVEEFQRETRMEWTFKGALLGRYTLKGSRRAFDEVINCQRSYAAAVSSQSDPFSKKKSDPFAD